LPPASVAPAAQSAWFPPGLMAHIAAQPPAKIPFVVRNLSHLACSKSKIHFKTK